MFTRKDTRCPFFLEPWKYRAPIYLSDLIYPSTSGIPTGLGLLRSFVVLMRTIAGLRGNNGEHHAPGRGIWLRDRMWGRSSAFYSIEFARNSGDKIAWL